MLKAPIGMCDSIMVVFISKSPEQCVLLGYGPNEQLPFGLYRKSSIRSRDWYSMIFTDRTQEVGVRLIIKFFP